MRDLVDEIQSRDLVEGYKISDEEADKIEKELGEKYGIDFEKYRIEKPKPFIMKNFSMSEPIFAQNYEYQEDQLVNLYDTKTGDNFSKTIKSESAVDDIIERMANGEDVLGEGDNQIQNTNNKQMGYTAVGLVGFITGALTVGIIILGVLLK